MKLTLLAVVLGGTLAAALQGAVSSKMPKLLAIVASGSSRQILRLATNHVRGCGLVAKSLLVLARRAAPSWVIGPWRSSLLGSALRTTMLDETTLFFSISEVTAYICVGRVVRLDVQGLLLIVDLVLEGKVVLALGLVGVALFRSFIRPGCSRPLPPLPHHPLGGHGSPPGSFVLLTDPKWYPLLGQEALDDQEVEEWKPPGRR